MNEGRQTVGRLCEAATELDGSAVQIDMAPGGVSVRAHIAGDRLASILGPSMLACDEPSASPQVIIRAVDATGCGVAPPSLPWKPADYLQREEIAGWTEPPLLAAVNTTHAVVSVADTDRGIGAQWFRDGSELAPWEGGSPMRSLLHWNLARHGLHMLHAAAIDTGLGGVLLAGPGGSGKSTSALAALGHGMGFVGDDYVLIRPGEPPSAHPLYSIAKADERSLTLLPQFADRAVGAAVDWRGKWRLPIADRIIDEVELTAIVLPRVAAVTGQPQPVDRRTVLRTLVPSILFQLPGDSRTTLAVLGDLLMRLPIYSLDVGEDVEHVPGRLRALCEEGLATR